VTTRRSSGFTLLELSIVLAIIALVTSMAVTAGISVVETARLTATQMKMKAIDDALMQYRASNDRLPCPGDLTITPGSAYYGLEAGAGTASAIGAGTGVCTGTGMLPQANFTGAGATNTFQTAAEGAIPAVTLGLSTDFMLDGWGNRFRYAVDISYTANAAFAGANIGCVNGAVGVNDANGNARSTGSIYALISHGANGHGAYTSNGVVVNAGSVNANEQTNCHCNSSTAATSYAPTYVQMQQTLDPSNALDNFDDLVSYKERWQMQTTWDKTGGCQYVYVADYLNNNVQVFNTSGTYLSQFGTSGWNNGQFEHAHYLALDSSGNLWATDQDVRMLKFSSNGTYLTLIGCSSGASCSGSSSNGSFGGNGPVGIAIDSSGNLWVVDSNNNRVEEFSSSGTFINGLGAGYNGISGSIGSSGSSNGQFNGPVGIAIDKSGNLWVTDNGNNRVEELNSSGTFLLGIGAGYQGVGGSIGSTGTANGQFNYPDGIAVDSSGNVWVSDYDNSRVQKFNSSGTYLSQLGCASGACSWSGAPGALAAPNAIAIDASGNIWVANWGNFNVEEFSSSGTLLQQFGSQGTGNGQFEGVMGIAIGR
jgi:prepilin-type N-terminal cleavage/methylation domain-containing protein